MTRIVSISEHVVNNIVNEANDPAQAILELVKFAVPEDWENISKVNKLPKVSRNTALAILDILGNKFRKVQVNMLWLQSGFGIDNHIKDWIVLIPEESYTLKSSDPIVEMMAKREIEEFISSRDEA